MTQQSPRCAIYTRQSRTNDSSFSSSDAQLGICREMVSSIGWRLVDVFQDPGSSSETLARPEMQRLMACAELKQFEHLVVYSIDRLTRRLIHFARLMELLDQNGVKLTVVTDPHFGESAELIEDFFNLAARGKTPAEIADIANKRESGRSDWNARRLLQILSNPVYAG